MQQNPACATCFMGSMSNFYHDDILPTTLRASPVLGPVRRLEANTSDESDIQIEAYQSATLPETNIAPENRPPQ